MDSPLVITRTAIALVILILLFGLGCGQFFPGSDTITALAIAPTSATIAPGVTQQYTATATYGNNSTGDVTSSVTWSTTASNVATINSSGLLSALTLGTATVRAQSSNGIIASTGVTVTQKQISSITIQPLTQTLSLASGPTSVQFTATATYADNTTANVTTTATWTSIPSSVATMSATGSGGGVATAVAVGTATITATSGGVTSNSATVTVTQ